MLHLVLSPHYDDGVLCCGGLLARQIQTGERAVILTVFAGDPPPDTPSALATFLAGGHADAAAYVATRQAEDVCACQRLGASWLHWTYPDCIYRAAPDGSPAYDTSEKIFGEVQPAERGPFVGELAIRLQALCDGLHPDVVYAPLTVGHHVDHQLVHWAARLLSPRGWRLRFYEDYPYAMLPGTLDAALGKTGRWQPEIEPLPTAALAAKMEAIACYTTQLLGLFGPGSIAVSAHTPQAEIAATPEIDIEAAMRRQVKEYAHSLSADGAAERYWRPVRP